MRDRIDLQQTAAAAQQQSRFTWLGLLVPVSVLLLLLLLLLMAVLPSNWLVPPNTHVFMQAPGGNWQQLPALPADAENVRVSAGGTVWASSIHGMSRLADDAWQHYGREQFGLPDDIYVSFEYTLVGEEVWAIADDRIAHFDGQQWTTYPEALADPTGLAATATQVWAINARGDLAFLDRQAGQDWTTTNLRETLPAISWRLAASDPTISPALRLTTDGTLWLEARSLWRFDGTAWTRALPDEENLRLLAASGECLWLRNNADTNRGLQQLCTDGRAEHFSLEELGLPQPAFRSVWNVAVQGDAVWAAERAGGDTPRYLVERSALVHFDGSAWQPVPLSSDINRIDRVRVAPGGALFLVGGVPRNFFLSPFMLMMLAVLLMIIVPMIVLAVYIHRKQQQQQQRTQEVLVGKGLADPNAPNKPATGKIVQAIVGFGAVIAVMVFVVFDPFNWVHALLIQVSAALQGVFPGLRTSTLVGFVPTLAVPLVLMIIAILSSVVRSRRQPTIEQRIAATEGKPVKEEHHEPLGQEIKLHAIQIGGTVLALILIPLIGNLFSTFVAPHLPPWVGGFFGSLWFAYALMIGFGLLMSMLFFGALRWPFLSAFFLLRRGDYGRALQRIDQHLKKSPDDSMLLGLKIATLSYAGRLDEAEELARTAVEKAREQEASGETQSVALSTLAEVLKSQGTYEEALPLFETAIELAPGRVSPYYDLAEVYLEQEIELARAQQLIEQSVANHHKQNIVLRWFSREEAMQFWPDLAWAQALRGDRTGALASLQRAMQEADRGFKPAMAALHYRAGRMQLALGDKRAATEHFQQAELLDPDGKYGRWAGMVMRRGAVQR